MTTEILHKRRVFPPQETRKCPCCRKTLIKTKEFFSEWGPGFRRICRQCEAPNKLLMRAKLLKMRMKTRSRGSFLAHSFMESGILEEENTEKKRARACNHIPPIQLPPSTVPLLPENPSPSLSCPSSIETPVKKRKKAPAVLFVGCGRRNKFCKVDAQPMSPSVTPQAPPPLPPPPLIPPQPSLPPQPQQRIEDEMDTYAPPPPLLPLQPPLLSLQPPLFPMDDEPEYQESQESQEELPFPVYDFNIREHEQEAPPFPPPLFPDWYSSPQPLEHMNFPETDDVYRQFSKCLVLGLPIPEGQRFPSHL
jgi:hypothetical protein